MTWRAAAVVLLGTALVLLGGLWILQGADLVHVRPVLCAANCKPVTGGSATWLSAGSLTFLAGLLLVGAAARSRHRGAHQ